MKLIGDIHAYPWTQMIANNCNTYAVAGPPTLLIDPGHANFYYHVEKGLKEDKLPETPEIVFLTHCHPDHFEAAEQLQKKGSRLAMHSLEVEYMQGQGRSLARSLGMNFPELKIDIILEEGPFQLGNEEWEVFLTPGHSPGHVCLYNNTQKVLFAGDLIFAQGVGRVDFPGGSGEELKKSIERMAKLDLEWVLPGHGPIIKGAESIRKNFEIIASMYFGLI
ncbi:MBL fold metallo-hydrolase [Dethiosulfatarculus sandiegensis]|uniref:Beta-lactamase n=1 Tax=Dethiosulfatarculus sandiegensis TaxID=1429043 RepID=A0A0D2J5U7_9BACT|nr:MBL fold metallo-hydrolase [Dethiosulfatarculus sandiegensis]KIX11061.1 beta-lactamase [Dethiosulfatarculus sandiegensis]